MTNINENDAVPRRTGTSRLRPILTVRSPALERLLQTIPVDLPERRNELRGWADALICDVTRWTGERRRGGLFAGPIRRADAPEALAKALLQFGEVLHD